MCVYVNAHHRFYDGLNVLDINPNGTFKPNSYIMHIVPRSHICAARSFRCVAVSRVWVNVCVCVCFRAIPAACGGETGLARVGHLRGFVYINGALSNVLCHTATICVRLVERAATATIHI